MKVLADRKLFLEQARTGGGAVVARAVLAMSGINDALRNIADEIDFETNFLALDAAVKAGRSATAAKEIKDLIQDSVKKVEDGSVLVAQSGQTLEQIVSSVKKVSDIIAEIAAASRARLVDTLLTTGAKAPLRQPASAPSSHVEAA